MGGVQRTSRGLNLYLAERDPQHHAWAKLGGADPNRLKLRILLSYWYYKEIDLDALFEKYFTRPFPDVFADSGGFSANTQGAVIDIHEYAAWIKRFRHLFDAYSNLDVISDQVATLNNQHKLEDLGLNPVPVFHVNEDWQVLENYIQDYQYIALGGMVPYMRYTERILPWIIHAFRLAGNKAVFHGFGATSWEVMKALPWYSVDSSSWGSGFRFGSVPLFDDKRGRFVAAKLGDPVSCGKASRLIKELGFEPLDFVDRSRNDRAKICAISALSYMKAEKWLRARFGEIHIPRQQDAPAGVQVHLADANPARFSEAAHGMQKVGLLEYLSDTSSGINYRDAQAGIRVHLADARQHSGGDLAAAETGLRTYLAEHSLDKGG